MSFFSLWTPIEDQKLRKLIMMHRIGDEIPWARSRFSHIIFIIIYF